MFKVFSLLETKKNEKNLGILRMSNAIKRERSINRRFTLALADDQEN